MIDPINSIPLNRTSSTANTQLSRNKEGSDNISPNVTSESQNQSLKDVVSLSFDLYGDPEELRNSMSVVFSQVKSQLEEYFGLQQEGEGVIPKEYLPDEDASAQDLLNFFSPENTANRIASFATGFFNSYLLNHQDESDEENVESFSSLISDAIKKGFDEAEQILGDFDELNEIGSNIKKTYELVLEQIDEFRSEYMEKYKEDSSESVPSESEVSEDTSSVDSSE